MVDAGTSADTGSVTWSSDLPNPYLFPGPDDEDGILDNNAYDFFLQYTVELPENNLPPVWLTVSICMQRAVDAVPACSSNANVALAGPGGFRWGFDPSQYTSGENIYEHTLSLKRGDNVLVERTLTFEVTAP